MLRSAWRVALPLLAILAGGPAAADPPPADIVKKIYEQATVFCNGEDVAPPYTDKFLREVFDKPLADRYLTRVHNNQIDFDIFVDGQDCKFADLVIEPQLATADTAIVRARFRNLDKPRTVDFDFHRSGATWMIGDMRYKHRPFSLRTYLKLKPRS
jgi:hypothetical protein